jgi:hypothetical protein
MTTCFLKNLSKGLSGAILITLGSSLIPQASAQSMFEVPANTPHGQGFVNTGNKSATCTFRADGQWTGGAAWYGPNGFTTIAGPDYPLPGVPMGALIARRTSNTGGVAYYEYVGSDKTMTLRPLEAVYFLMNERSDLFVGNQGALSINFTCR